MNVIKCIKEELSELWDNSKNRIIIKDVLLLAAATLIFHIIYWNCNMNEWIFGPFTQTVYDFFRHLAFNLSCIPCKAFIPSPFDINDTSFCFYQITQNNIKVYNYMMEINVDCSGVKQLLQFLIIMVLCRGNWLKKIPYFIIGCLVILFFNIVRIFLITYLFVEHPEMFQNVHDWVARPLMYVIIFLLWLLWVNVFAKPVSKTAD